MSKLENDVPPGNALMPSITQNRMRLARMTGQQALSAVRNPGGKLVSEEVAEVLSRARRGRASTRDDHRQLHPKTVTAPCVQWNG